MDVGASSFSINEPGLCAFFDATPIPLIALDDAAKILHANPFAEAMFGYGRFELDGLALEQIATDAEAWLGEEQGALIQRPLSADLRHRGRRRDGGEFPLEIGLSRVEQGENARYLITLVDISVRKGAEARLRRLHEEVEQRTRDLEAEAGHRRRAEADLQRFHEDFRFLFQRGPLPMWLYSPVTLRFLEVNDAALSQYGYSRDEFLAMTVRDIHPPEQMERANSIIQKARGTEFLTTRNWKHKDRSGKIIEVDTYSRALGTGPTGARLVVAVDVTARNAAEAQLRQAQKMEAIGQLTGGVAHDFNNLLLIILGNLELILEECSGRYALRSMAEDALASVHRGASLTQRLLAFARQQPLEPRVVDTAHLLTDMTGLFRRSLGETISIHHYLAPDLWKIRVDPSQLENALLNLAVNARDAMPHGGKLTIEAQNTVLDEEYARENAEVTPGEYVELAVSDTGSGIAKEILEHILEPFFTTKPVGKGTGLGLSMVYGFLKQSDGHLKIYSEEGYGTTVRLYVPRAVGDSEAQETPALTGVMPRSQNGEVILLVEDDATIRKLVTRLLEMLGYRVLAAEDGTAALDLMSTAARVDLLFTDVVLPNGTSGAALAAEALLRHPRLRVLYMSGYTRNALMNSSIHEETAQLLSKPFRKEELARAVHRVLNS